MGRDDFAKCTNLNFFRIEATTSIRNKITQSIRFEKKEHFAKSSRGQTSVYILLGLIVILAALLIGFLLVEPEFSFKVETSNVQNYIESCLRKTAEDGVYAISLKGGRINANDFEKDEILFNYGLKDFKNVLPSVEDMEKDLSFFIGENVLKCINQKYPLDKVESSTIITLDKVTAKLKMSLEVETGIAVRRFEDFSVTLPLKLGRTLQIANELVETQISDPDWIDLSKMAEYEPKVSVVPIEEDKYAYAINNGYKFLFLIDYQKNYPPRIYFDEVVELKDNIPYRARIFGEDEEEFYFESFHPMVDVTSDGWISFTPRVRGVHEVVIRAVDVRGGEREKKVKFIVTK